MYEVAKPSRWSAAIIMAMVVTAALTAGACSDTLETGYQPKPLNMGLSQRRALYSDPFSPEAQQAAQDQGNSADEMNPSHAPGQY